METIFIEDNKMLCFSNGRWYWVEVGNGVNKEIYRNEAITILVIHSKKHLVSEDAWRDVILKDQPLKTE